MVLISISILTIAVVIVFVAFVHLLHLTSAVCAFHAERTQLRLSSTPT
jgi:hypothetical protein